MGEKIQNLDIEGDSINVTLAIKGYQSPNWKINYIIQEAISIMQKIQNFSILHCYREANKVVDFLANQ